MSTRTPWTPGIKPKVKAIAMNFWLKYNLLFKAWEERHLPELPAVPETQVNH